MFNLVNKQVVIKKDVIVYEIKGWDWNKNIKKDSVRIMCDEQTSEVVREVRQEAIKGHASRNRPQRMRNMPARLQ